LTEVLKAWMTEAELFKAGWPTDRVHDGKLTRLSLCGLLLK
jgi:hypothetical protein